MFRAAFTSLFHVVCLVEELEARVIPVNDDEMEKICIQALKDLNEDLNELIAAGM